MQNNLAQRGDIFCREPFAGSVFSDEGITGRYAAPEAAAIIKRLMPGIMVYAWHYARAYGAEYEDLIQEGALAVLEWMRDFPRDELNLKIVKGLRARIRNAARKEHLKGLVNMRMCVFEDEEKGVNLMEERLAEPGTSERTRRVEIMADLERLLPSVEFKIVSMLREGHSLSQIARVLAVTKQRVHARVRAIAKMLPHMAEYLEEV